MLSDSEAGGIHTEQSVLQERFACENIIKDFNFSGYGQFLLLFFRKIHRERERDLVSMAARPPRVPTLDLRAFLLRVQALRLVRSAFRSARRAPPSAREELEQTI